MPFSVGQRVLVDGRDPGKVTSVNQANEMYDVQLDTGYRVRKHSSRLRPEMSARQNPDIQHVAKLSEERIAEAGKTLKRQVGVEARARTKAAVGRDVRMDEMRESGAQFYVRSDPPRLLDATEGEFYTGNPVEGQAYFIAIDPTMVSLGAHFLTVAEVDEADGSLQKAAQTFLGSSDVEIFRVPLAEYGSRQKVRSLPAEAAIPSGSTGKDVRRAQRLSRLTPPMTNSGNPNSDAYVEDGYVFYVYGAQISRGEVALFEWLSPFSLSYFQLDETSLLSQLELVYGPVGEFNSQDPSLLLRLLRSGMVTVIVRQKLPAELGATEELWNVARRTLQASTPVELHAALQLLNARRTKENARVLEMTVVVGSKAKARNPNFAWVRAYEPMSWTGSDRKFPPMWSPEMRKSIRGASREPTLKLDSAFSAFAEKLLWNKAGLDATIYAKDLVDQRKYLAQGLASFSRWAQRRTPSAESRELGYTASLTPRAQRLGLITYASNEQKGPVTGDPIVFELSNNPVPLMTRRSLDGRIHSPWNSAIVGTPAERMNWTWVAFSDPQAVGAELKTHTVPGLLTSKTLATYQPLGDLSTSTSLTLPSASALDLPDSLLIHLHRLVALGKRYTPTVRETAMTKALKHAQEQAKEKGLPVFKKGKAAPSSPVAFAGDPLVAAALQDTVDGVVMRYLTSVGPKGPGKPWMTQQELDELPKFKLSATDSGSLDYRALKQYLDSKWGSKRRSVALTHLLEDVLVAENLSKSMHLRALGTQYSVPRLDPMLSLLSAAETLRNEEYRIRHKAWLAHPKGYAPAKRPTRDFLEAACNVDPDRREERYRLMEILLSNKESFDKAQATHKAANAVVQNALFYRALSWDPEASAFRWTARGSHLIEKDPDLTPMADETRIAAYREQTTLARGTTRAALYGEGAEFLDVGGRTPILFKTYNKALYLLTRRYWTRALGLGKSGVSKPVLTLDDVKLIDAWGFYGQSLSLLQQMVATSTSETEFYKALAHYRDRIKDRDFMTAVHTKGGFAQVGALWPLGQNRAEFSRFLEELTLDYEGKLKALKDKFLTVQTALIEGERRVRAPQAQAVSDEGPDLKTLRTRAYRTLKQLGPDNALTRDLFVKYWAALRVLVDEFSKKHLQVRRHLPGGAGPIPDEQLELAFLAYLYANEGVPPARLHAYLEWHARLTERGWDEGAVSEAVADLSPRVEAKVRPSRDPTEKVRSQLLKVRDAELDPGLARRAAQKIVKSATRDRRERSVPKTYTPSGIPYVEDLEVLAEVDALLAGSTLRK